MQKDVLNQAEKYKTGRLRKKRWHKVVGALGCVAVFCTTYAMILPAITLDSKPTYCGIEEHVHTDDCYLETVTYACGLEESEGHTHTNACYDGAVALSCDLEESEGHTHTQDCYDQDSGHVHTADCYAQEEVLTCTLEESDGHAHTDDCYAVGEELTCTKEESDGHTHGEDCYDEDGALTCDLEESDGHTHTADCYEADKELTCKEEESNGHTHTADCYQTEQTLTCDQEEGEANLICGQEESDGHTHTTDCYTMNKTLSCNLEESDGHTHTDDCNPQTLRTLTCAQEEHTHTDECYVDPEAVTAEEAAAADQWSQMTDEAFVAWVTGGEHDEYLQKLFQDMSDGNEAAYDTFVARMDAIWENTEDTDTATELYTQVQNYTSTLWGLSIELTSQAETYDEGTTYEINDTYLTGDNVTLTKNGDCYYVTFKEKGTYKLTEDIDLGKLSKTEGSTTKNISYIYIGNDQDITIDLNGHVLKGRDAYCVIYVKGGTLTIKDSDTGNSHYGTVTNNLWVWDSSATTATDDSVEIKGGIITGGGIGENSAINNYSYRNSGIYVSSGTLTINGGTIVGNQNQRSSGAGGGIDCYGTLNMSGGRVCYNTSTHNGGGIFALGTVEISGEVKIDNNYATDYGGGIRISSQDTCNFTMSGGYITDNKAGKQGGGIEISMGHDYTGSGDRPEDDGLTVTATLKGVTITGNSAGVDGGGISISENKKASVTLNIQATDDGKTQTTISGNTATGNGGGVYMEYGVLNFDGNAVLKENGAKNGGGIYLKGIADTSTSKEIVFYLKSGTVSSNTATENGGGFAVEYGNFEMTGGTIAYNTATEYGGGGYISGNSTSGGTVTISQADGKTTEIYSNSAKNGGGLAIDSGSLTINGGTIGGGVTDSEGNTVYRSNTAQNGGGVYVSGGTTTINGGTILGNIATATKDDNGTITDDSTGNGGGLAVYSGTFIMNSGNVANNTAENRGGGAYIDGGSVTINDGSVQSNEAAVSGGGIYVHTCTVTLNAGAIQNNTAAVNGGGLSVVGSEDSVDAFVDASSDSKITISGNTATTGNGGGIYMRNGSMTLAGGVISNNTAVNNDVLNSLDKGNGGGIYVKDGSLTMNGGTISGNTCSRYGGGLYIYAPSTDTITYTNTLQGGTISGNMAEQCGGGVTLYQTEASFTATDEDNDGTEITGNQAIQGAGVYLRWSSVLNMTGGYIHNNLARSLDNVKDEEFYKAVVAADEKDSQNAKTENYIALTGLELQDSNLDSNPDNGGNGGGIYVLNSTLHMNEGDVTSNTADRNGGGIYGVHNHKTNSAGVLNTNPLTMDFADGGIDKNTAKKHGGGVAMFVMTCTAEAGQEDDQGAQNESKATSCVATISGSVTIQENSAENGGGFYVGGGQLNVTGGFIRDNTAKGWPANGVDTAYEPEKNVGVGGGIYVYRTGGLSLVVKETSNTSISSLGVYSNTADFAADDVYCSPNSNSIIGLPAVKNMVLTDYENHTIGKAEAWFEDYPTGDSMYSEKRNTKTDTTTSDTSEASAIMAASEDDEVDDSSGTTESGETTATTYTTPTRYRTLLKAAATDATAYNEMVEFEIADDANSVEVNGYICLTLGFSLTRYELTIEKQVEGTTTDAKFEFEVTIEAKLTDDEVEKFRQTYLVFGGTSDTNAPTEGYGYTVEDEGESGTTPAKVTFSIGSGESVTLKGIPENAKVTVTEKAVNGYGTTYTYTTSSGSTRYDADNCVITVTEEGTKLICYNIMGYELPSTGGAGIQLYTISGLLLVMTAVACGSLLLRKRVGCYSPSTPSNRPRRRGRTSPSAPSSRPGRQTLHR